MQRRRNPDSLRGRRARRLERQAKVSTRTRPPTVARWILNSKTPRMLP